MIDPIQNDAISRLTNDTAPRTDRTKIKRSGNQQSTDPRLKLSQNQKSNQNQAKDAVALNFNLRGDLQTLQNSVNTVFDRVQTQLENYFSITGQDPEAAEEEFFPPEDASANEILEFFNPKNTAGRIVNFATGFFSNFAQNNPNLPAEEQTEEFTTLITDAVQKGFGEAKNILGDLSGNEDISQNIEQTYQLVLEGIEEYRVEFLKRFDIQAVDPDVQPEPSEQLLNEKKESTPKTNPDTEIEFGTLTPEDQVEESD